tara:strand:- start:62925 stop:63377 length:453 start_codon:yes stop_codon:yes gene_type:complete
MHCVSCEIKNLIYGYAECMDQGDFRAAATLFEHARMITTGADGTDVVVQGIDNIESMYRGFTRLYPDNNTPHTLHLTSNVIVESLAEAAARSRSCVAVMQAVAGLPLQTIITVRYEDEFARVEGKWRFSERRMIPVLLGDLSHHLLQPIV